MAFRGDQVQLVTSKFRLTRDWSGVQIPHRPPKNVVQHVKAAPASSCVLSSFAVYNPFYGPGGLMPSLTLGDAVDRLTFLLRVDRTVMVHQRAQAGVTRLGSDHLERELSRLMGTKVRLTGTDRGELCVKFSSIYRVESGTRGDRLSRLKHVEARVDLRRKFLNGPEAKRSRVKRKGSSITHFPLFIAFARVPLFSSAIKQTRANPVLTMKVRGPEWASSVQVKLFGSDCSGIRSLE